MLRLNSVCQTVRILCVSTFLELRLKECLNCDVLFVGVHNAVNDLLSLIYFSQVHSLAITSPSVRPCVFPPDAIL